MTCAHCSMVEQRGRYCVGCGRRMPFALRPARPVTVVPRAALDDTALDDTRPVLRFTPPASRRPGVPSLAP